MKRIYGIACAVALTAGAATGQDLAAAKQAADQEKVNAELTMVLGKVKMLTMEGGLMSNIKGAPYSGQQITENTQILGDGTRIHTESAVKVFRDGEGRVRRETPDMISIFDPVAGVGYTLYPNTMTGSKMQVSVSVNRGPNSVSYSATATAGDGKGLHTVTGTATAGESVSVTTSSSASAGGTFFVRTDGPNIAFAKSGARGGKREDLGSQNMEGVNAQGTRNTHTIEAGAIGNDRPIETVEERWYSPDLQTEVMTRHSDPRTGEQITRLVNIQRGEPGATLFQAPAGYQISEGKTMPRVVKDPQ
jgi:hypothetical protein